MKNIAIDGPSGAGKSTLSREIAARLGFIYVDTGALYRTVGLYAYRNGVDADDAAAVTDSLPQIHSDIKFIDGAQHVFLNGEDVSDDIRIHAVSDLTSKISAIPAVRSFLLETQRDLAAHNNVIMDGRDIGTVVLPDADVKIFLTASPEARAHRRYVELCEKGQAVDYETVLRDVVARDERDMNRETAPLRVADGAVVVDTSDINFEQSLEKLLNVIKENLK